LEEIITGEPFAWLIILLCKIIFPVAIEPFPLVIICRWQIIFPLRSKALRSIALHSQSLSPFGRLAPRRYFLRFISTKPDALKRLKTFFSNGWKKIHQKFQALEGNLRS
jgi:hypothetical protein